MCVFVSGESLCYWSPVVNHHHHHHHRIAEASTDDEGLSLAPSQTNPPSPLAHNVTAEHQVHQSARPDHDTGPAHQVENTFILANMVADNDRSRNRGRSLVDAHHFPDLGDRRAEEMHDDGRAGILLRKRGATRAAWAEIFSSGILLFFRRLIFYSSIDSRFRSLETLCCQCRVLGVSRVARSGRRRKARMGTTR
jgi:hypothetical protein